MSHQEPDPPTDVDLGQSSDTVRTETSLQMHPVEMPELLVQSLVGQTLHNTYRILSVLEQGGMGTVFRGEHLRLHRPVAIKVLAQHLVDEPAAIMRFRSEAEIISQLHHPHVVHILDYDTTDNGDPYIVMELLTGETLSRRLYREHTIELRDITQIVLQTAGGLLVAHAAGIVHRDLKPDNVFLIDMRDNSTFVKLLDFGISKRTATYARVTREFEVLGTPDYMAPEQIVNSAQTDHRADQWSLAAISYEMLSGRIPFFSDNVGRTLTKVLNEDPPLLCDTAPGVSRAIAEVVRRGLAKSPIDRFPTIMEFAEAFAHAAAFSLAPNQTAWNNENATQNKHRTPPLGEMRSADTLLPPASSAEQTRPNTSLDSENRLPIPTVPRPPLDSAGLWPHSPAQTLQRQPSTPPPAATARRSIAPLAPRPITAPRSSVPPSNPPSSVPANSRLRTSEPPAPQSTSELPRESLRPARLPQRDSLYGNERGHDALNSAPTEPTNASGIAHISAPPVGDFTYRRHEVEPYLENVMGELRITLEEIRQAVMFGEELSAISKARHAVQIARNARRPESRELLSNAGDLLRPLLLRSLGGSQRRVNIEHGMQVDSSRLSPEHLFLLSRVDGTTTIEELLDTSPLTAAETLGILLDFRDLGCLGIE